MRKRLCAIFCSKICLSLHIISWCYNVNIGRFDESKKMKKLMEYQRVLGYDSYLRELVKVYLVNLKEPCYIKDEGKSCDCLVE